MGRVMPYCHKCGSSVEEEMMFCPRCGASLKTTSPPPVTPQKYQKRDEKAEKNEKNEKNEKGETREKQEKGEQGIVGFLIGGLILITIGFFLILQLSGIMPSSGQNWAIILLIIGIIIIVGAVYVATSARKRFPQPR